MVNKRCAHPGCLKQPSYGAEETKMAELCAGHAKDGMVDVIKKRCAPWLQQVTVMRRGG